MKKIIFTILFIAFSYSLSMAADNSEKIIVKLTAYTPRIQENDKDPFITASMKHVKEGCIAVSRDLYAIGWTFGKLVDLGNYGIFEITDIMNSRHKKTLDIFMWDLGKANEFGVKYSTATLLN